MKTSIVASALWLIVLGSACRTVLASGAIVSDHDLGISFVLPDGFEAIPDFKSPPKLDVRHAFSRMNPDGQTHVAVFVVRLPGVIGREPVPDALLKTAKGVTIYHEKWKSFDVDVFVVKETTGGQTLVTRNVQIPIEPCAIQLKVLGPQSEDTQLADLTRTILASVDGPTNWLTVDQRYYSLGYGLGRLLVWIVAIGAVVYALAARRTGRFRRKAISLGLPEGLVNQKIRPSWAWYLLPAYLLLAGVAAGSLMVLQDPGQLQYSLSIDGLSLVAAISITIVIMRRRKRTMRKILATLPPLPTEPGPSST